VNAPSSLDLEMPMIDQVRAEVEASIGVKRAVLGDPALLGQVARLAQDCLDALRAGGKVIFAGNGGSFADAQHLSAEFTSRFLFDRAPLASLALGTNNSAISAIGNDYGYEHVFSRELEAIAKPDDIFIPITTSGNSPNVLAAVGIATRLGIKTVVWTGASGGRVKPLCECICIPSSETARIQECHILIGHILCGLVEAGYFQRQD
jgi:D-sedoheptulose 7-phosphate isomerase